MCPAAPAPCYRILLASLICLCALSCRQQPHFDETTVAKDTARINALYRTGRAAVDTGNRDTGRVYFHKGIAASRAAGNIASEGNGYLYFHYLYRTCGMDDSAYACIDSALSLFKKEGYTGPVFLSFRIARLGQHLDQADFVSAIDEGHEVLAAAKAARDTISMAQSLGMLAQATNSLTDYEKGLAYLEQAVALARQVNEDLLLYDLLTGLANAYDRVGSYDKELRISREMMTKEEPGSVAAAYVYATASAAWFGLGNLDSAAYYLQQVEKINEDFGDPSLLASVSSGYIDIYLAQKRFAEALALIDSRLLDTVNNSDIPTLHGRRAEALEGLGRYAEALKAERRSHRAGDFQSGDEVHKQVALVEGKYRTREKERAIKTLSETTALQKRWLLITGVLLAITLLLAALALLQYRRQRKATALIVRQAERLLWLMKEVHHRVKNNLQVIISLINMETRKEGNAVHEHLLTDTVNRIQSIALIHQKLYQNKELESVALKDYIAQLANAIVSVHGDAETVIESPVSLDIDTAEMLGMVITELITNSHKHARLPGRELRIHISVLPAEEGYELRYCDNGPGLPEEKQHRDTMGMRIINLMARQMGGDLSWTNEDGACCHIFFKDEEQRRRIA